MSRDILKTIFRNLKDGIIAIGPDRRIIEANTAIENICGVSLKEIKGKNLDHILLPCNKVCHRTLGLVLKKKKAVEETRVECGRPDRHHQVVQLTAAPLMDPQSGFIGAMITVRKTSFIEPEQQKDKLTRFHNLIGQSGPMREIFRLLEDLSGTETTVLITGESGTGKEVLAEAIHYQSPRASKPLIKVNCSALPETLLESELFGHVKGAFTGAVSDRKGRFQAADGGTIFLDEIGEISPRIRLRLLRVLEQRKFERVGDTRSIGIDVRIIAATNQDLREKMRLGEFQEDLYYRVKVVEVTLAPLRERTEDIPLLVDHFLRLFNRTFRKNIRGLSEEVFAKFRRYPWPGNVRELKHVIEHAFVFCHGQTITTNDLPDEFKKLSESNKVRIAKSPRRGSEEVLQALIKTDWNKAKAARLLGVSRQTIYRKIDQYGLEKM
jgi:PAS domain S-box-containing protein